MRIRAEGGGRYGAERIRHGLRREGRTAARCTAERLMEDMEIQGMRRGASKVATSPGKDVKRPRGPAGRSFCASAPDRLRAAGLTCAAAWSGFACAAFIVGAFARRIAGRSVPRRMSTALALDALGTALRQRSPGGRLARHDGAGARCLSVACSERLAGAGVPASAGSAGDACDSALAETASGLFKSGVIRHRGPWRGFDDVGYAAPEWADWYNNKRLSGSIGFVPPAEPEAKHWESGSMQAA